MNASQNQAEFGIQAFDTEDIQSFKWFTNGVVLDFSFRCKTERHKSKIPVYPQNY